jgi:hypothetical protein
MRKWLKNTNQLIRYIRLQEEYSSNESLMQLLEVMKANKQKDLLIIFRLNAQEKKANFGKSN